MSAAADIVSRLQWLAVRRRALAWLLALLPWIALRSAVGGSVVILFAAADLWRLRRKVERHWTTWLDQEWPGIEDSSLLLVKAATPVAKLQQARMLRRAGELLGRGEAARVAKHHVGLGLAWVLPSLALAAALWAWQRPSLAVATPKIVFAGGAAVKPAPTISMHVAPPGYTGLAAYDSPARDLQVPAGAQVSWCVKGGTEPLPPVELSDGRTLSFARACTRWKADDSVFWRWNGARFKLRVTADAAPEIAIATPQDILTILAPETTSTALSVAVRDDYRVARATLHLTLARGSGENVRFSDREMPVPASDDPKLRKFERRFTLADLGMERGDELYFFVRAFDNADKPQSTQSPTYTLRLPGPEVEAEESTALPSLVKPESLRSQRQIIIDTEQLLADMRANPRMPAATIRARSETIAGDQGMLRRRYGQFLGEESSLFAADDHAGQAAGGPMDVLHEYGHAHDQAENATLFDEATKKILRRALTAMWDAEKSLRAIEPKRALLPENKALLAIKELQQADRIYLHKTAFAPPPIKEEKRMTGELDGAASYHREQAESDDAVPAKVRGLMSALSAGGALPALWSRDANDWIRERIRDDEQRLAAQRAVQDVADGCEKCRPVLRAWLRGAIGQAPVLLQARPVTETAFTKALQAGGHR